MTLVGPGGVGKTRLALQVARQPAIVRDVHYVALQPVTSPDYIVPTIADALGFQFSPGNSKQQLLEYLNNKDWLLLLDNLEHLLDGMTLLSEMLDAAPHLHILATSRERLNLREEWVLVIEGLHYPGDPTSEPLNSYSAVQLFVQRARQAYAHFSLRENADAVKAICQQVEGIPLALELAATWLRAMTCSQIAAQMRDNLAFLTTSLRNVPERHRSLRAVFEQSWNMLREGEQAVLMRLSVFRGGYDLEAAQNVADASLPVLAALVDKAMICLRDDGRYDLHELLRQYAAEKLASTGETSIVADQHLLYYLSLAEQAESHIWSPDQLAWFNRLEIELDNLRAALAWSLQGGSAETGLRLVGALGWFFIERPRTSPTTEWLERMLAANGDAPGSLRAKVLNRAGELSAYSYYRRFRAFCEEALVLARTVNDRSNIAWALGTLGFVAHLVRQSEQSEVLLDESIALFRELNDPFGLNHAFRRRAWVAINQEDYSYARALLAEAFTGANEVADRTSSAWALLLLGMVAWLHDHDLVQAKTHYLSSSSLFREAGNVFGVVQSLTLMAEVEQARGDAIASFALYRKV